MSEVAEHAHDHAAHESREPLKPVPAEPEAAKRSRADTSYIVLRRGDLPTGGDLTKPNHGWVELSTLKAASRKAAIREATKDLPAPQRSGEFAAIREAEFVVLSRKFEQRTVEEDVFG
jgi:hypothetical protein